MGWWFLLGGLNRVGVWKTLAVKRRMLIGAPASQTTITVHDIPANVIVSDIEYVVCLRRLQRRRGDQCVMYFLQMYLST